MFLRTGGLPTAMKQSVHGAEIREGGLAWRFRLEEDGITVTFSTIVYGTAAKQWSVPLPAFVIPAVISHLRRGLTELRAPTKDA